MIRAANTEKSVEPVVHQARLHEFKEGWLAVLRVMGVLEDSPLRNPEQIPYLAPPPPVQSQANAADEEDTPSIRELVKVIDSHIDPEVTSHPNIVEDVHSQLPLTEAMLE